MTNTEEKSGLDESDLLTELLCKKSETVNEGDQLIETADISGASSKNERSYQTGRSAVRCTSLSGCYSAGGGSGWA